MKNVNFYLDEKKSDQESPHQGISNELPYFN